MLILYSTKPDSISNAKANEQTRGKHIITLGKVVFYALRTGKENSRKFGGQNLKYELAKGIHICYVPNPSARNVRFFNSESKLKDWEQALEWFLSL